MPFVRIRNFTKWTIYCAWKWRWAKKNSTCLRNKLWGRVKNRARMRAAHQRAHEGAQRCSSQLRWNFFTFLSRNSCVLKPSTRKSNWRWYCGAKRVDEFACATKSSVPPSAALELMKTSHTPKRFHSHIHFLNENFPSQKNETWYFQQESPS